MKYAHIRYKISIPLFIIKHVVFAAKDGVRQVSVGSGQGVCRQWPDVHRVLGETVVVRAAARLQREAAQRGVAAAAEKCTEESAPGGNHPHQRHPRRGHLDGHAGCGGGRGPSGRRRGTRRMGKSTRLFVLLHQRFRRSRKRVALSLPLLQEWRRWVNKQTCVFSSLASFFGFCVCCSRAVFFLESKLSFATHLAIFFHAEFFSTFTT